jgi:NYN domain
VLIPEWVPEFAMNDLSPFPTSARRARIALLVDGNSVSPTLAPRILAACDQIGRILVKRVYGDAAALPGWARMPGFFMVDTGPDRQTTDDMMTVEAMQLSMAWQADTIVIASHEGDFALLSEHLRESGKSLVGLGEDAATDTFRRACVRFLDLSAQPQMA